MSDSDIRQNLDAYCAAWSDPDPDTRRALLERAWDENGVYCDPTVEVTGCAALSEHIGRVHLQAPGARIELTSGVDMHHGAMRFEWQMVLQDGTVAVQGIDFATVTEAGQLASVTGFFGPLPAQD